MSLKAWFWIVAGPNGSGKTTLTNLIMLSENFNDVSKLNADDRTAELKKLFPETPVVALNLRAAQEIDAELLEHIRCGKSVLVETVLSSPKYRDDVLLAKQMGMKFGMLYMSLRSSELNVKRVADRVAKGGHPVASDKIKDRFIRSHAQLVWFARRADVLQIYDNSNDYPSKPELLVIKQLGTRMRHIAKGINEPVDRAVAKIQKKRYAP